MPPLELDTLWTVAEAAEHATRGRSKVLPGHRVTEATVRSWAHRGHLPIARNSDGEEIRDHAGRPRFWPLDVARAEYATRARALIQLPAA